MRTIRIDPLCVGTEVLDFLEREEVVFKVHSTFTHAVNLLGDHCLITISDRPWMRHPYSIVSREPITSFEWRRAFVQIELEPSYSVNPIQVNERPKPIFTDWKLYEQNLTTLQLWLHDHHVVTSSTMQELSMPLTVLHKEVFGWRGGRTGTLHAIHQLIGRGGGFTPAGDDVLVGMLALIHQWEATNVSAEYSDISRLFNHLRLIINRDVETETSFVSAWMLKYAVTGHCLDGLQRICKAVVNEIVEPEDLDVMLRIGHTSGKDMLIGVYTAGMMINQFKQLEKDERGVLFE